MNGWHRVRVDRDTDGNGGAGERVVVVDVTSPPDTLAAETDGETDGETAEEPTRETADVDCDVEIGSGAEDAACVHQARAPRRVLPRPEPAVCPKCLGVGTLRVLDSAGQWYTTTTRTDAGTSAATPAAGSSAGPSAGSATGGAVSISTTGTRYREVTCGACDGLGWVLLATTGPVRPTTTPVPAQPQPWWQPPLRNGPWQPSWHDDPLPPSLGRCPGIGDPRPRVWC